jgi:hypothetical protein
MVPIHDTDVAEERWSKAEWENYELWEKVELRLKRQKRLWIFATLVIFLVLSAVPIVMERWPKWSTRSMTVTLAREINRMKRESSIGRSAFRLRFVDEKKVSYVIEKIPSCSASQGEIVHTGTLLPPGTRDEFLWVSPSRGDQLGVPGLVDEFCYDYLAGSGAVLKGQSVVGFGIIPVSDLTEKRIDRLSVLILSGPSAEISFD